jgi:hypothetical protein
MLRFDCREKDGKSGLMIAKCANPSCGTEFRYLRGGKVYLLETKPIMSISVPPPPETEFRESGLRSGEYFWLCEDCAKLMTIAPDGSGHALIKTCKRTY